MESHQLGIRGEDLASEYLLSRGYIILERNWRHQMAEIDILALKEGILAVIEVKTRSTVAFGTPEEFIGQNKIRLLRKAANAYVNLYRLNVEVRFDYIGIVFQNNQPTVRHIKDACFFF